MSKRDEIIFYFVVPYFAFKYEGRVFTPKYKLSNESDFMSIYNKHYKPSDIKFGVVLSTLFNKKYFKAIGKGYKFSIDYPKPTPYLRVLKRILRGPFRDYLGLLAKLEGWQGESESKQGSLESQESQESRGPKPKAAPKPGPRKVKTVIIKPSEKFSKVSKLCKSTQVIPQGLKANIELEKKVPKATKVFQEKKEVKVVPAATKVVQEKKKVPKAVKVVPAAVPVPAPVVIQEKEELEKVEVKLAPTVAEVATQEKKVPKPAPAPASAGPSDIVPVNLPTKTPDEGAVQLEDLKFIVGDEE